MKLVTACIIAGVLFSLKLSTIVVLVTPESRVCVITLPIQAIHYIIRFRICIDVSILDYKC